MAISPNIPVRVEVEFEVKAAKRRRITLEPEIYRQLEAEERICGVVPETFVNLWLAEKLKATNKRRIKRKFY
jgi:hypothetical protein